MGDVTGPISTLPGTGYHVPDNAMCDRHPERPAVARIQGETDSFGCEMIDMCRECLDEEREYERTRDRSGVCDWCKRHAPRLRSARSTDEGMYGPVYDICDDCKKRQDERIEEELRRYDAEYDFGDWDGDDWS